MKKLFSITALTLSVICVDAQVTQEWVQTFNPVDHSSSFYMAMDNGGNIYTAGPCTDYNNTNAILLLKYDPMGNLLWSQINPAAETATGLVIDGNGDVILTGTSTVKYDPNGAVLWTVSNSFLAKSIAVDENNDIYLHGQNEGSPLQTAKYNSSGVQQWIVAYTGNFIASAKKRMVYKNGYIYVTGDITLTTSARNPPLSHVLTIKYNASNGARVWATTYTHSDKVHQLGTDLIADGTGNVYVTARVWVKVGSKTHENWGTLKYNSSGAQQWVRFYDGNAVEYDNQNNQKGSDIPNAIAFDNSGNIIVCGTSYTTTGQFTSQDMTTIKYSSAGTELWVRTYDSPSHLGDAAQAIVSDGSSNVYITGGSNTTTIKYNSAGVVQWTVNYNGGSARSLLLDNSANVYVCGTAVPNSLLIKYSQGGGSITSKDIDPMQESSSTQIRLFPNPAINQVTIQNPDNKMLGTISIYDMTGKMVYKNKSANSIVTIDVKKFTGGVYYFKSDNQQATIKFVKL